MPIKFMARAGLYFFACPMLIALLVLSALPGCATVSAPVDAAETVEQKAFALYGTFVVFEELGATIVENRAIPLDVRRAIQSADQRAKPLADGLLDATFEVQSIRLQLEAGTNTVERLDIATAELENWVTRAGPVIARLVAAVREGT